jgi:hypothetical protein
MVLLREIQRLHPKSAPWLIQATLARDWAVNRRIDIAHKIALDEDDRSAP